MRAARAGLALAVLYGLAGCMVMPAPKPQAPPPPPAHTQRVPDWFDRQMVLARAARRDHVPHSDIAGARQAYYRVALAACEKLPPDERKLHLARCNALMQASVEAAPAAPGVNTCDEGGDEPDKIVQCND
jgi:hypothetical protein